MAKAWLSGRIYLKQLNNNWTGAESGGGGGGSEGGGEERRKYREMKQAKLKAEAESLSSWKKPRKAIGQPGGYGGRRQTAAAGWKPRKWPGGTSAGIEAKMKASKKAEMASRRRRIEIERRQKIHVSMTESQPWKAINWKPYQ